MTRGEYKVPQGKLVAADVEVLDGHLSRVRISGDFFLEPDDALERIDAALTGLRADVSVAQMTGLVESAVADAHLIGFTPQSVAIAVRRALGAASSWSDHTFEIVHPQALAPIVNLALDQVLLEEVAAQRRGPTLRLWEWDSSCVVIGSFQSLRNEVDLEAADELGVQVVRRISGGGAMFMEPGNAISYSLYVPGSLVDGLSFEQSYAFLDDWVLGALNEMGVDAHYVPLNDISSPSGKIGGAAQKRLANGTVLHHATMSYDIDADKMLKVLRIGREKLSDKGTKSANKRVDPMRRQTGMSRAAIIESMKNHFRARYDTVDGLLKPTELARAEQLVTEKFAAAQWLERVP
ncbi:lipoate--protein ligase family protein [Occultella glacieicola]|uniref:Lipoate--protein ligase family protein n=1 Tax=Occultella glacieicola TaxID=2518684 RepID=A0ABY2E9B8_9MICO|nr:biotin/lipoate A/B protein ligase family protein [Occultella glacieicola]TDE95865.1 lipoate--protein ligase family protein [Occultella glacieicola]